MAVLIPNDSHGANAILKSLSLFLFFNKEKQTAKNIPIKTPSILVFAPSKKPVAEISKISPRPIPLSDFNDIISIGRLITIPPKNRDIIDISAIHAEGQANMKIKIIITVLILCDIISV